METKITGKFSGKEYYASEAIRIMNPAQAAAYWAHGIEPLDIYSCRDVEKKPPAIAFVFRRNDTKEVFDLWCKHQLNQEDLSQDVS